MSWFNRKRRKSANRKPTSALSRGRFYSSSLQLEALEQRAMLANFLAVGTDAGVPNEVRIFTDTNLNGKFETRAPSGLAQPVTFTPYSNFTGGVRVALGDFDGDNDFELVTAAGPGGGPHVIIWHINGDGSIGGILDSFFAYDSSFTGGVFIATG